MKIFNKWPYWVRGGIILNILFFLVGTILALSGGVMVHTPIFAIVLLPAFLVSSLIVRRGGIIEPSIKSIELMNNFTVMILISIVSYFLIGAILGLLYGKMKNYKSDS